MTIRSVKLRVACVAALVLTVVAPVLAEDAVPLDRRMPRTALLFVSVRNVPELTRKFNESNTGKLVNDPAVKDFREQVVEKIGEQTKELEGKYGLTIKELLSLPQGEMAFAMLTTKGKLAFALVMDFGEGRENVLKLLEKSSAELEETYKRSEEEFEGTDLVVFQPEQENNGDDAPPRKTTEDGVTWGIKDTHLLVTSSADTAKSILRFWQDGTDAQPLAETDAYKTIIERCRASDDDRPPITWFMNPIGMVQAGAGAAGGQGFMILGALPTLGLDKFRGIGGTIDLAGEEYDSISRTMVILDQPRRAVLNALEFPQAELAPPKWVPGDVAGYRQLNWDLEKAYGTVEQIYDQFAGKGNFAKMVDDAARNNETANLHYKKDIVDHLTGKVHIVGRPGEKPEDSPTLFALEIKDQEAFKKSLGKVTGHPAFPGKRRTFQGTDIWEIETQVMTLALTVAQQQFLIATDVPLLEAVLRGGQSPLTDSADFKEVAKRFPSETSYIGYTKTDAQYRNALQMMKTESIPGQTDLGVDFSKLPKFEDIQKYFTPGGSYMTSDERGLFIVSFTLKESPSGD